jgi:predicted transcriptional regulator
MSLELKVMLSLHNLGVVKEEVAKTPDQLASTLNMNFDDVKRALETLSTESYVGKIPCGNNHAYFLTGKGIVTVCSMFT